MLAGIRGDIQIVLPPQGRFWLELKSQVQVRYYGKPYSADFTTNFPVALTHARIRYTHLYTQWSEVTACYLSTSCPRLKGARPLVGFEPVTLVLQVKHSTHSITLPNIIHLY